MNVCCLLVPGRSCPSLAEIIPTVVGPTLLRLMLTNLQLPLSWMGPLGPLLLLSPLVLLQLLPLLLLLTIWISSLSNLANFGWLDLRLKNYYASPSSGDAYSDRQLTLNFELRVEIFCVPICFHMRIPKSCPSVSLYPEERNNHSFVNVSPTVLIDIWMESMKPKKIL